MKQPKPKSGWQILREQHKLENPDCPYGDRPHFVPASFGQVGFHACMPPKDLTDHTRCRPPFDHDCPNAAHFDVLAEL